MFPPDPVGISPQIIFLTGCIVTWWGRIEYILINDIYRMRLHPDLAAHRDFQVVQIATKRRIWQWRRGFVVVPEVPKDMLVKVDTLTAELYDLAEDRHLLMHSMWDIQGQDGGQTVRLTNIKPDEGDVMLSLSTEINAALLDELNSKMYRAYHQLVSISTTARFSRHPPFVLPKALPDGQ